MTPKHPPSPRPPTTGPNSNNKQAHKNRQTVLYFTILAGWLGGDVVWLGGGLKDVFGQTCAHEYLGSPRYEYAWATPERFFGTQIYEPVSETMIKEELTWIPRQQRQTHTQLGAFWVFLSPLPAPKKTGKQNPKTELSLSVRVHMKLHFGPQPPRRCTESQSATISFICALWYLDVRVTCAWRLLKSVIAHLAARHLGLHRYRNLSPQVPGERKKKKKRKAYRKIVKLFGIYANIRERYSANVQILVKKVRTCREDTANNRREAFGQV